MIHHVKAVAYGRPATEALARVVEKAKGGLPLAPVTVLVPSNLAGLSARRLLGSGELGGRGIANVAFLTPFRLAQLLAADLLLGRQPLTSPVLGAAVRRTLAEEPGPFVAVAHHHATEQAISALHRELSGLDPSSLRRLEGGGPAAASAVAVHRTISSHLGSFHDERQLADAATTRADLASRLAPFGHLVWFLPGPLSPPLRRLLAAAMGNTPASVIVGVTGDEAADEEVWKTCRRCGVPPPTPPTSVPVAPPAADRIISVTDAEEEVRAVTREVVALAEEGVALHRIAVLHPAPDPYSALLLEHFAAAGIPCNGPARRRVADHVAGRVLLGALELHDQGWGRANVMALTSGAPLRHRGKVIQPGAWEEESREAGIVGGLQDWQDKLAARQQLRPTGSLADLASFVEELARGIDAVRTAVGWPAKSASALALLHQLLGSGPHAGWPEAEEAAFTEVQDTLARLAALEPVEPDPAEDVFARALTAELDVSHGRVGRFGNGVLFGPLSSAPGLDLDAVFVLGCREGLCPAPRREDAMLPESARALVAEDLSGRASLMHEQHRSFLAALAAAEGGRRVLTFARGDLRNGRHALPSRWLLDSAGALAGHHVNATDFGDLGTPIVKVVPSFVAGLTAASTPASLAERDLAAVARHVASGGSAFDHPAASTARRGLHCQQQRRSVFHTEWDGNLTGRYIPSTTERPLSPSVLEDWATCGYRYFLGHVLGVGERDKPERIVDLRPADRGALVHEVLERFFTEAIAAGVPEPDQRWTAAQRARLASIAAQVFSRFERAGRTGRPVLWHLAREEALTILDGLLSLDDAHRAETRARPEAVELSFGLEGSEPLRLSLTDGTVVSFRGRLDRVDRTTDGRLLVSDYKTGKGSKYARLNEDAVQRGRTLQLGLYAEAALQQCGGDAVDAHYLMLDMASKRLGYPWTPDRRERFIQVLSAIVTGIEQGIFNAVPGSWSTFHMTHENCRYCPFDNVCDTARGEQADAQQHDPSLRIRALLEPAAAP